MREESQKEAVGSGDSSHGGSASESRVQCFTCSDFMFKIVEIASHLFYISLIK